MSGRFFRTILMFEQKNELANERYGQNQKIFNFRLWIILIFSKLRIENNMNQFIYVNSFYY